MAATATSLAAASLTSFRPESSTRKLRYSISGISLSSKLNRQPRSLSLRVRIRAVQRDETFVEERENELLTKLNGNGSVSKKLNNGSVSNGSVIESDKTTNGSLVKYASGNRGATPAAKVAARKEEAVGGKGNKTIEEIGQEDAWFKRTAGPKVEVSVAPGGRWSRFKTYSTIQRTVEIWGFVLTFLFKAWLNNQKFSYRG